MEGSLNESVTVVNRIFIYCQVVFSVWLQLKAAIFNFPGSRRYLKSIIKRKQH